MESFKMRAMVTRNGDFQGISLMDLVRINGIPYAVFEWQGEGENRLPLYKARLDDRALMELPPAAGSDLKYQYRISIEDPRPFD